METSTLDLQVAERLRATLQEQGRRQAWLANTLGLKKDALSRRMRGRIPFKATEVERAAAALGVPVEQLLRES